MSNVLGNLWNACAKTGAVPKKRFDTVQDFHGHILELYPAPTERAKAAQATALQRAIKEAEQGHIEAAAVCIRNIQKLVTVAPLR
jgi:hypothetical protein